MRHCVPLVLLAAICLAGCGSVAGAVQPSAPAPELSFRAHFTRLCGTLSGGVKVSGTVYPSVPSYRASFGPNHVKLVISRHGIAITHGWVSLTSRMIDMAMAPNDATVRPAGSGFQGKLVIPMFGSYRISLGLHQGGRTYRGFAVIRIPLPTR